ncbi:MAG: hypothetical protein AAFN70_21290, partial [Planctomycetota bacterium]
KYIMARPTEEGRIVSRGEDETLAMAIRSASQPMPRRAITNPNMNQRYQVAKPALSSVGRSER